MDFGKHTFSVGILLPQEDKISPDVGEESWQKDLRF